MDQITTTLDIVHRGKPPLILGFDMSSLETTYWSDLLLFDAT